jgi:outer membrane immunogenic protein
VNGGWGSGKQDPLNIITDRFDQFNLGISGGMFGGTLGAQVQVAHVVLGVESDIDWADISGSGTAVPKAFGNPLGSTFNMSTKLNSIGTGRIRAGLALDNWLYYVTGGLALAEAQSNLTNTAGPLCGTGGQPICSGNSHKVGAAAGLGVEYGITPNLSAKLEYIYMAVASVEVAHVNEIRLGLNYRFGGN